MTDVTPLELLAPAGGMDAALAAFHFGADAVYLGLRRFSARAEAENFDPEALEKIAAHAHALTPRRRVFAAINTLALDAELPDLLTALDLCAQTGVDAVILQDLAVARLARRHFPSLRLHASTQLAVHSRPGVEALARLGFERVVLARELTLEEIAQAARVPGIEIETFLHGALCYAYSGLCLLSSMRLGKSGNRGACAYPCRDLWRVCGGRHDLPEGRAGFAFSMCDLALPDQLERLREAGVTSLKIEGRKKSPLYVAAAVDFYRRLCDGQLSAEARRSGERDLKTIFSRPWTELYVPGARHWGVADPSLVGHRGAFVGHAEQIEQRGGRAVVHLTPEVAIERHDGLQIELPGLAKPFGFGVERLWRDERATRRGPRGRIEMPARPRDLLVRAEPGFRVAIELPAGAPEIPAGAAIHHASSNALKRRFQFSRPNLAGARRRHPLAIEAHLSQERLDVRARMEGGGAPPLDVREQISGPFDPARSAQVGAASVRRAFEKLGDTPFALSSFTLDQETSSSGDTSGWFVPASRLNDLRRSLVEQLTRALGERRQAQLDAARGALDGDSAALSEHLGAPAPSEGQTAPGWILKIDRLTHVSAFEAEDFAAIDELIVDIGRAPLPELAAGLKKLEVHLAPARIRLALPVIARGAELDGLKAKIEGLRAQGFSRFEIANVAGFRLLDAGPTSLEADFAPSAQAPGRFDGRLTADWPLYALNPQAAAALFAMGVSRVTLSPEDGFDNWRALARQFGRRAVAVVYQDTPLFISESCPHATLLGRCPGPKHCGFETMELDGSHGTRLTVVNDRCRSVTLLREPLNLTRQLSRIAALGLGALRVDFAVRPYAPCDVRDLWRAIRAGQAVPGGHGANFERGLAAAAEGRARTPRL